MTNPVAVNAYAVAVGTAPNASMVPFVTNVGPASTNILGPNGPFKLGQTWVDSTGLATYTLVGLSSSNGTVSGTWVETGGSSGAISAVNGTANQVTVTTSSNVATVSLPSAITTPGSLTTTTTLASGTTLTAGTSITATLGNITATNGNVVLNTAGNKLVIATGSNASVGTSDVMSGTPGAVTVATTASSATAKIFYSRNITGGTPGQVSITAQDGTGFTLTSTGNETSTFNWWIINA